MIDSEAAFRAACGEATALLNAGDGAAAVAIADDCTPAAGQEFNVAQLQAAMYTDGGHELGRRDIVDRGATLWRTLDPGSNADIAYNLGNAELALYELGVAQGSSFPVAWQDNRAHLAAALTLFEQVGGDSSARNDLRLQALTNAGNAYDKVGRYIDALELYDQALAIGPDFGMALGNRGVALEHAARLMRGHAPTVLTEAAANLDAALTHRESIVRFGGTRALPRFEQTRARIRSQFPNAVPSDSPKAKPWSDPHMDWCRRNELFLHVSHACVREDTKRTDPLFFQHVITGITDADRERVHRLVDAFDAIKQEYVAARYTLWLAADTRSPIREHAAALSERVTFLDSLEYARWGIRTGMAMQALASASNVLDKAASFVHLYLGTTRKARGVYFEWLWQQRSGKPMDAEIAAVLERPNINIGLLALCDLSCDLRGETALGKRVRLRHTATHRFLVSHTEMVPASDEWFDRMRWRDLVGETIAQLRAARAALIYLARMIDIREHGLSKHGGEEGGRLPGIPMPAVETGLVEYE